MLITTKQKRNILKDTNLDLDLNLRESELEVVQKTKYLGVQIDCSLDWKEQIKAVSAKVSRAVGFLKHAKNFLPRETLKTLYTGIVEPHFRYCCSVWGCCGSTEINQLQKLQNRAARIVTNSSFNTPSRPLIEVLGWKTIEQLISIESKTMVFKSLNELAPQYLCGPGLPFGRFHGQISRFWPFWKTLGRQRIFWPRRQKLAGFWPYVEKSQKKQRNIVAVNKMRT